MKKGRGGRGWVGEGKEVVIKGERKEGGRKGEKNPEHVDDCT